MPIHVLEKGQGLAFGLIDYGPEHNLIWVTAIDETGETLGRPASDTASPGRRVLKIA
jgi:hypothetical protein